jgi:hypothetical protein
MYNRLENKSSGPAIIAHGSLDLKQEIQIQIQIQSKSFSQRIGAN